MKSNQPLPRNSTVPRCKSAAAWATIALLTVASMGVWWAESEWNRHWILTHDRINNQRSWRYLTPPPDRYWSIWPHWVDQGRNPAERRTEQIQVGLLVGGLGLTCLAWVRDRRAGLIGTRRHRRGPGEIAAMLSTVWLAVGVLGALSFEAIYPLLPTYQVDPWTLTVTVPRVFLIGIGAPGRRCGACSIAMAWIYLAVAGRWGRQPTDPIERVGRVLGWTWIGTQAARLLADLIGIAPYSLA